MSGSPNLPRLSQDIAGRAIQDLNLLAAEAYGDAAMHAIEVSVLPNNFTSMENALEVVHANFNGSEMDSLLETAFQLMALVIEARSLENPAPMQIEVLTAEHLDKLSELRDRLKQAVTDGDLPAECAHHFEQGMKIATCQQPPKHWVSVTEVRKKSVGTEGRFRI